MTYFGFLAVFLGIPLLIMAGLTYLDWRGGRGQPPALQNFPAWAAVLLHVAVAVIYTTPWDNYLVATGVWYYNPRLVTGITLGWVPVEEYTFFVLQTLLTGLWLLFLARRLVPGAGPAGKGPDNQRIDTGRKIAYFIIGAAWLWSAGALVAGWKPGTYLALILIWALPPIALQLFFGADLLWRYRRLVLTTLLSVTIYLSAADSLAIGSGTWTIAPGQSLEIYLGGVLPVEELLFFLVTNTLIVFGITLLLSQESRARLAELWEKRKQAASLPSTRRELANQTAETSGRGRKAQMEEG